MNILFVLHDYLPAHSGGSELHAHQLAKELIKRGHDCTVLFTERDFSRPEGDFTDSDFEGVPTVEVIHQREYSRLTELWEQSFFVEVFRSQMKRLRPDVVHFHHTSFWGARCMEVARNEGVPVVLTLHDYALICYSGMLLSNRELCDGAGRCGSCLPEDMATGGLEERVEGDGKRRKLHRRAIEAVDAVISPSEFLFTRFDFAGMPIPEAKRQVLVSGYPGARAAVRQRAMDATLRVTYIGGLYEAKGVHVLIAAFRELHGRARRGQPRIELEIHGHLDWFPDYCAELRVAAEGLPVSFCGPFAPGTAHEVLEGRDVLVVPSIWFENRPITIPEAFINGLVPVVTDLGGMAESLDDGIDGLTFERGNATDLADCLERLASEPGLWSRLAAARPELPDMAEIALAIEGTYSSIGC